MKCAKSGTGSYFGLFSHKKVKKLFCTFEDRTNLEKK